jgi:hypothetical protein
MLVIRRALRHPEWVPSFADETRWNRLALPNLHAGSDVRPWHLVQRQAGRGDLDPKSLACYGLLRADTDQDAVALRAGAAGQPADRSFLGPGGERLAASGKQVLLLAWDNAGWHISQRVRAWIKGHNRRVRRKGGGRLVARRLPVKSPWLNAIESKWAQGKKAIVEPGRLLTAQETTERVGVYSHGDPEPPLVQPMEKKVA